MNAESDDRGSGLEQGGSHDDSQRETSERTKRRWQFAFWQLLALVMLIAVALGGMLAGALAARLTLLFLAGLMVGTQLNRGIYRLAFFHPRSIGPWSPPPEGAPPRRWYDFLPVLGWISLRRESRFHGRGYWVRPLLVELATGGGYAALYWWDAHGGPVAGLAAEAPPSLQQAQFLLQAVLVSLMIVATFIDFDEKTIPDAITVPGALLALVLAASLPESRLPIGVRPPLAFAALRPMAIEPLLISSPRPWPDWLDGAKGLLCGLACYLGWCYAVMPFIWNTRRGIGYAARLWLRSVIFRGASRPYHLLAAVGCGAIGAVWASGWGYWPGLLSALVGMAFGGGLIWAVRIVGTGALRVEAMGFGDVILMAMIGAFLGWQPALLIFFLAPFAAVAIAVAQFILTRRHDIAFGPYLCLATGFLIVAWSGLWHGWAAQIFGQLGWLVPAFLAAMLLLMGVMLAGLQMVKAWFRRKPAKPEKPRRGARNRSAKRKSNDKGKGKGKGKGKRKGK